MAKKKTKTSKKPSKSTPNKPVAKNSQAQKKPVVSKAKIAPKANSKAKPMQSSMMKMSHQPKASHNHHSQEKEQGLFAKICSFFGWECSSKK